MTKRPSFRDWQHDVVRESFARVEAMRDDLIKRLLAWLVVGNGAGLAFMASLLANSETKPELRAELLFSSWLFALGLLSAFIFGFFVTEMMVKASAEIGRSMLNEQKMEDGADNLGSEGQTDLERVLRREIRSLGISALAATSLFMTGVVNALIAAGGS